MEAIVWSWELKLSNTTFESQPKTMVTCKGRRISGRWSLLWVFLSCWHGLVSPFTPISRLLSHRLRYATSRLPPLLSTKFSIEEDQKEGRTIAPSDVKRTEKENIVEMTFVGRKSVSTTPILLPEDGVPELNEFFLRPKHRNLLFFRNDVSCLANPSDDLIRRWSEEVAIHGGSDILKGTMDSKTKSVLRMKAYVKMPGLRILSETLVGANLILHDHSYPEYEFTVIDTILTPEGTAPLVWLFKKLTRYMDKTSSFSRVRPVNVGGKGSRRIVFTSEAILETRIHLPSAAARVLPMNVRKFEEQGSRSMQKLLEKELEPALFCFRDSFVKWLSLR